MSMPIRPEVVSYTIFTQDEETKLWNWQTKAINNEIIATGTEETTTLRDCIKNFFFDQGVTYGLFEPWPSNYGPLKRLPEEKYQINKYLSQGN